MTPRPFEVYMLLKDRKRLARLIEIQEVSRRQVATAAGWRSHTYLLRLLSGEVRTLEPEHAVKIATFLGVDVADLFTPRVTSNAGQIGKQQMRRPRRAQVPA
jgi:transcriptional regulator with XRE-family HTH domain